MSEYSAEKIQLSLNTLVLNHFGLPIKVGEKPNGEVMEDVYLTIRDVCYTSILNMKPEVYGAMDESEKAAWFRLIKPDGVILTAKDKISLPKATVEKMKYISAKYPSDFITDEAITATFNSILGIEITPIDLGVEEITDLEIEEVAETNLSVVPDSVYEKEEIIETH